MTRARTFNTLLLACCVAASAGLAGHAAARAEHGTFYETAPFGPTLVDDACLGEGVVGTMTGTSTLELQYTLPDSRGQHGLTESPVTSTATYRVDFPDGTYLLGEFTSRGTLQFTDDGDGFRISAERDDATYYDAEDNVIGSKMVRVIVQGHYEGEDFIVDAEHFHEFCR